MIKIAHRGSTNGKVIDHRGNATYYKFPENSMLSYINAIKEQFDMIEADIILTKDNQLIMHHNVSIGSQFIRNLTYKEIKERIPSIPTFQEFCTVINPRIKTILDIKGDNKTALAIVKFLKKNTINTKNFYFSSFNRNHLQTLYNYNKKLTLGLIYDGVLLDQEKTFIIKLFNLKFVSISWKNLYQKEIDFYKKMSIQIFVWTNNNYITHRLIPKDVDGVISDYFF